MAVTMFSVLQLFRTTLCLELHTTDSIEITTSSDMSTPDDGEITTKGSDGVSTGLYDKLY